ncbi:MAG: right-handed parallel beta-helix repeat-containing protein [Candidatus Korarchaeum sp.]
MEGGDGRITINGNRAIDYGLLIYAWDGTSDPDIVLKGMIIEDFTNAGIYIEPSGQVLVDGVEVRRSGVGVAIYSGSRGRVTLRGLSVHDNNWQGIYVVASSDPGETEIIVESSRVYGNAQGIWINGSSKAVINVFIGDPLNSDSRNYVYGNSAEGIVLSGNVRNSVVAHNVVGSDGSSPRPNAMGGITLANGVSNCRIINNEVAYNGYQNILLMGNGTEGNEVDGNYVHCDPTLQEPLCYVGIYLRGRASGNLVGSSLGNTVTGHRYEGIAVVREADGNVISNNRVGSFNQDGSYNGNRNIGNGAGIAVINAAVPDIHYPFPVYARTSSADVPGPSNTLIRANEVAGNRGAGVILIRAVSFEASLNEVYENSFHGFYWVGSSGAAYSNYVHHNDGSGFRVEPYWGLDSPSAGATSPLTYDDDLLSSGRIYGNSVEYNKDYGLLVIDNPWVGLDVVNDDNYFWENEPLDAVKLWLGHIRVLDPRGNPLAGLRVDVFRGGDDGDDSPDYSCVTGADGRCGPPGFDYDDASTWFAFVEEELSGSVVRRYNPHGFAVAGVRVSALYSWNGLIDAGESGGSLESPPGSGAFRYQYAQLTYALRAGRAVTVEKCHVRAELNATGLRYPLSPGDPVNYTLKLIPSCDRALEIEAEMRIPEKLIPLGWYPAVGTVSYDDESRLLRWRGSISGNTTVLEVVTLISGDAELGDPILTRADLTCLSPNCLAYRSDDPATPGWEDHTLRTVSLVTLRTLPSRGFEVPFNLSPYGEFSLLVSGCGGWSLSLGYPLENGSVLSNPSGILSALPPRRLSSCEVKFTLVKPSSLSRPLLDSKLSQLIREFSIRLEVIPEEIEPELKVEVRPRDPVLGKPFTVRLALVNPSGFDLNASLRIPLDGFKLLSVVHSTHGELRRIGKDLLWRLELPAGRSSSAQLTLIPEAEGEVSSTLRLIYSAGGPEYERTFELRLRVSKGDAGSSRVEEPPRDEDSGGSGFPTTSPSEEGGADEPKQGVETEPIGRFSSTEERYWRANEDLRVSYDPIFLLAVLILASVLAALTYSAAKR